VTRFRVFARREDAERFIAEVRGDDPEIAAKLRIEERDLESGEVRSCRMGVTRPIDDAVEAFPALATGVVLTLKTSRRFRSIHEYLDRCVCSTPHSGSRPRL